MFEAFGIWLLTKIGETAAGKLIIDILEKKFPKVFKNKTREVVEIYEARIEEKNEKIRKLVDDKLEEEKRHETEEQRLVDSLKRRSIATEKLLEQYHKPVNAIVISYASQHIEAAGKFKKAHFIKDELARFNSKYLGGTDTLIPPMSVPDHLKTQVDLQKWFEEEILKGRYCKVKFMILFDLRKSAIWGTFLPYTQKRPMHLHVGEVLSIDEVFAPAEVERLALSEIIHSGDIAWLASSAISGNELLTVMQNQQAIEKALGNPSLRVLAQEDIKQTMVQVLSKYLENADLVADEIIEEANFWYARLSKRNVERVGN